MEFLGKVAPLCNRILRRVGWELVPLAPPPRAQMEQSLAWLSQLDPPLKLKTVLDVGASDGNWSLACSTFFPNLDYVLFEPFPVHQPALKKLQRSSQRYRAVHQAVANSSGQALFECNPADPYGGALSSERSGKTIEVPVTSIDASVAELGLSGPFLLKLDTHGGERAILSGAASTLPHCQVLIIETYNYPIQGTLMFWELCAQLDVAGFRPVDLVDVMHRKYDGSLWQMDLVFLRKEWPGFRHIWYS